MHLSKLKVQLTIGFENTEFAPGWSSIYLSSGIELDIMTVMKGISKEKFEECFSIAKEATINTSVVKFLHLNHLLKA